MQLTYLRYECADAFSLTCSSGSTPSVPHSSSILSFLGGGGGGALVTNSDDESRHNRNFPLLSIAGSQLIGYDIRRGEPILKIGHRELLSGGVGSGRALNSCQIVCLDVFVEDGIVGGGGTSANAGRTRRGSPPDGWTVPSASSRWTGGRCRTSRCRRRVGARRAATMPRGTDSCTRF